MVLERVIAADIGLGSLSGCEYQIHFCNKETQTSRSGNRFVELWVSAARHDRVPRTVAQANVGPVERLIEGIRQSGYQWKQRERLAHSVPGPRVKDKIIQGRIRRTRHQSWQELPKGRLENEIKVVKFKVECVRKGCLPVFLSHRFLIYPYTK